MKIKNKIFRLYLDTSIFGGCFDREFESESIKLFSLAKSGHFIILVSEIVLKELESAPQAVKDIVVSLPETVVEKIYINEEVIKLRDAYLEAKVLSPKWMDDAGHVATATVFKADAIVSWNFKHIVSLDKMKAYNAVNLMNGYGIITIVTPRGVLGI